MASAFLAPGVASAVENYDYVVVGGGSAGCVLANRLSANPADRVCLIEAGPPDTSPLIHVPLGFLFLLQHRRLNWGYWTERQPGADGRSIYVPRGRSLGGSSSLNGMVYMRGHADDYDDWAAQGAAGWAYRDVLPYFLRSENNEHWRDSPWHGRGGPLNVANPRSVNPLVQVFFDAAAACGIPACEDFNVPAPEGYGLRQLNQRDGRRESSATAFLQPVRGRPNLTVVTGALVQRVLFSGRRACGVEFVADGVCRSVAARGKVVLSAGTIGSPAILLRSGIGDGTQLQQHGIAVQAHRPEVGRNYQDHPCSEVGFDSPSPASYGISLRSAPRLAWSLAQYLLFRRGMLTSPMVYASAFVRSRPEVAKPDLQLVFLPARRPLSGVLAMGHGFGVIPILLRPRSRGRLTLGGPDAATAPRIDPRYLSDPQDLELLAQGVALGRRVLHAAPFDRYRGRELSPGPVRAEGDGLRAFVRSTLSTAQHPVGTCRMGADEQAVVDPQLKVRGVEGLYVADASVMPSLIAGNTHAPVVMIAEKAADLLRGSRPLR